MRTNANAWTGQPPPTYEPLPLAIPTTQRYTERSMNSRGGVQRSHGSGRCDRCKPGTPTASASHPQLGPPELDCDVLTVPGDDQVLIVYSAAPGSPQAEALALLRVLGIEPLTANASAGNGRDQAAGP